MSAFDELQRRDADSCLAFEVGPDLSCGSCCDGFCIIERRWTVNVSPLFSYTLRHEIPFLSGSSFSHISIPTTHYQLQPNICRHSTAPPTHLPLPLLSSSCTPSSPNPLLLPLTLTIQSRPQPTVSKPHLLGPRHRLLEHKIVVLVVRLCIFFKRDVLKSLFFVLFFRPRFCFDPVGRSTGGRVAQRGLVGERGEGVWGVAEGSSWVTLGVEFLFDCMVNYSGVVGGVRGRRGGAKEHACYAPGQQQDADFCSPEQQYEYHAAQQAVRVHQPSQPFQLRADVYAHTIDF